MTSSMAATALIVIDVQESALRGCPNVNEVIANINQLVRRGRAAGSPVIFVQHDDASDPDMAMGSAGWQLSPALDRVDTDTVMPKTFRDAFAATDLEDLLARAGSRRLVLVGVHSDFCVITTALSAVQRGYDITLVSDAHTAQTAELQSGSIAGPLLIDLVNTRIATLRSPGRVIEVLPTARVEV
jgi:nicotinamidase-related amidase